MKNVLLLAFFMAFGISGMMAQKACSSAEKAACAKTCEGKKMASASADTEGTAVLSMAKEAASTDESIEVRTCPHSGKVSFYQKQTCEKSGKVSFNEVEFNQDSKEFVNVSPRDAAEVEEPVKATKTAVMSTTDSSAKKASCASGAKKACCAAKKEGTK